MRIAKLRMYNFVCFAGDTELALEPKAYAVIAQNTLDVDRSNWSGKSTLLESILLAICGRHRYRLEDDWITRGATTGSVEVVFDDGVTVKRSRKRGVRTELQVTRGDMDIAKDAAQAWLESWIGLSEEDLLATCVFEQRQIAKLILTDPSDRMAIVSRWFAMDKLVDGEDRARVLSTSLAEELAKLEQVSEMLEADLATIVASFSTPPDVAQLGAVYADAKTKQDAAAQALSVWKQVGEATERKARFDVLVKEGNALRDLVNAAVETVAGMSSAESDAAIEKIDGEIAVLEQSIRVLKRVGAGTFDGACPVLSGFACPATLRINAKREEAGQQISTAAKTLEALSTDRRTHADAVSLVRSKQAEVERLRGRLESMKRDALALHEKVKADEVFLGLHTDPNVLRQALADATVEVELAYQAKLRAENFYRQRDTQTQKLMDAKTKIADMRPKQALQNACVQIFGKNGAQRRVAESSLSRIEQGANALLSTSAIPLSVAVQWSREGGALAKTCDTCGFPFPASAKIKACTKCATTRGLNQINKLEFQLSDRSGAAEDLAGISIQLAASAWLRAKRGSNWGVALLDEPFGQLDAYNRKAMGLQIANMLSGQYGFEQSFLVAHHAEALDALPGRIQITRDGATSKVRVVS